MPIEGKNNRDICRGGNWHFPASFCSIFVFSTFNSKYVHFKILPMTGFEPWTSSIAIDCSANWATTTAQVLISFGRKYFSIAGDRTQATSVNLFLVPLGWRSPKGLASICCKNACGHYVSAQRGYFQSVRKCSDPLHLIVGHRNIFVTLWLAWTTLRVV